MFKKPLAYVSMISFTADKSGRIDGIIASSNNLSRSFVASLIDQGKVRLNKNVCYKSSTKVHEGDKINLDFSPQQLTDIPEISLPILYEDDDCLVIEKPIGLLTHSKGAFNPEATVSSFIRPYTKEMEDNRGGIVHRLDRITSGVLICAKTPEALTWLQKQFSQRKNKKTYYAVVQGKPQPNKALIDIPIERNPNKPQTFRAGVNGKTAKTTYEVEQTNGNYSLLKLQPETGRTHQLRVHMSYIKHPILGDELYGGQPAERVYLHANKLEITLPNRQRKVFECPVPDLFKAKVS